MKKSWFTKRSVRIGILLVIGFMIGGVTSYMTALNKAKYMAELQAQEAKTGNKVVRNKDGTYKIVPLDKPRPGTEIPTPLQDEPLEQATTGDAPAETLITPKPDITPDMLVKQAQVRAHTQPPMGMYVPGHFTLKDHNGKEVTEKSWPGKYLLVYFGYAHCPDVCPVTLAKMAKAVENLGTLAKRVQPLFITVDPARDTPQALKEYVSQFGKVFIGLTGTPEQVKEAEESYNVTAAKTSGETQTAEVYNMDHSAYTYLMSPDNKLEELLRIEHSTQAVTDKIKLYLMSPGTPK